VIVVEQPFSGRADLHAPVGGGGQARVRVLQDAPAAVEAVEEGGPSAGALAPVQPLPRRQGVGPLGQMLGPEQLAANGAGEEILAGLGTAWDESEGESGRLERSDGADLGWMTGAVYDGLGSKARAKGSRRGRPRTMRVGLALDSPGRRSPRAARIVDRSAQEFQDGQRPGFGTVYP
jgi:hypothetical protein